ncbi:hypothetical protein ACWIGW_39050 [Nocardia brasiliensis]
MNGRASLRFLTGSASCAVAIANGENEVRFVLNCAESSEVKSIESRSRRVRIGMNGTARYVVATLGITAVAVGMAPEAAAAHQRCIAWTCASTPDDGLHVEFVDVTLDVCNSGALPADRYKFRLWGPGLVDTTDVPDVADPAGACKNIALQLDLKPDRTFADGDRICVEGIRLREGVEYSMGEPCLPLRGSAQPEPAPSGLPIPPSWPEGLGN